LTPLKKKKKAHAEHICSLPVQHAHSSAPPKLKIVILEKLSAICRAALPVTPLEPMKQETL